MKAQIKTIHTPKIITDFTALTENIAKRQEKRSIRIAQKAKRTRLIKNIVFTIILIVAAFTVIFVQNAQENARFEHAYNLPQTEIIVGKGDTLDGIAAENPVDGLSAHELGYVIGEINKERIDGTLQPGDRILIPVEEK